MKFQIRNTRFLVMAVAGAVLAAASGVACAATKGTASTPAQAWLEQFQHPTVASTPAGAAQASGDPAAAFIAKLQTTNGTATIHPVAADTDGTPASDFVARWSNGYPPAHATVTLIPVQLAAIR